MLCLCRVVFGFRNFTNKPPSPMAAAASKRKFRSTNCTNRMPSIDFDAHTLCLGVDGYVICLFIVMSAVTGGLISIGVC